MCCYYDRKRTEELRKKMKKMGGTMRFWKAYRANWNNDALNPICYGTTLELTNGVIDSGRTTTTPGKDFQDTRDYNEICVNRGIHVALDRNEALSWENVSSRVVIVCVTAHVKDLIAVGDEIDKDAVFTKVTLSRKSFKKALKVWATVS